jgi:hypothetical protein
MRLTVSRHQFRTLQAKTDIYDVDIRELSIEQLLELAAPALTSRELHAFDGELRRRKGLPARKDLKDLFSAPWRRHGDFDNGY